MISYDEACLHLEELADSRRRLLGIEMTALEESVGRIAANDITAKDPLPAFANSAMDGFLLRHKEIQTASPETPIQLSVRRSICAGDNRLTCHDPPLSAIEIMTGAAIPVGDYDTVVKVEDVHVMRDENGRAIQIALDKKIPKKCNIRDSGEDFSPGQSVIQANTQITCEHLMAFAALGICRLPVYKKPNIVIFSTGKELGEYDSENLASGCIRNSSAPYLFHSLQQGPFTVRYAGIVEDDAKVFSNRLKTALAGEPDVVLTTGAVSVGQCDFIAESLKKLDAEIVFHGVKIRPGKPILCAQLAKTTFFGLPGNPISSVVGLRFFVLPYLARLLGLPREVPLQAVMKKSMKKPIGLKTFLRGKLSIEGSAFAVMPCDKQDSFMIHSFVDANCFIAVDNLDDIISAGQIVPVFLRWPQRWECA